jgi:[ribosomal protein S5]-alanine N-acetyltransferase
VLAWWLGCLLTERLRQRYRSTQPTVLSDREAMQFYPQPFDRQMTQAWVERNIQRYARHGFGLWALILKESGKLIGDCGLVVQEVDGVEEVEIGYHIRRDLWGKGLATERLLQEL